MSRKAYDKDEAAIPALTSMELEAIHLAAQGHKATAISQIMHTSPSSATRYVHRALKKLLAAWPATLHSSPIQNVPQLPAASSSRILTRKAGEARIHSYIRRSQTRPDPSWAYVYVLVMDSPDNHGTGPHGIAPHLPEHVRDYDAIIDWDKKEWLIFLPAARAADAQAVARRIAGERSWQSPFGVGYTLSGPGEDFAEAIQKSRRLALEDYAQAVFYSASHKRTPPGQ